MTLRIVFLSLFPSELASIKETILGTSFSNASDIPLVIIFISVANKKAITIFTYGNGP